MAKRTQRDRMWQAVMKRTHRDGGAITAAELSEMGEWGLRSARDALATMADFGVVRREKRGRENVFVGDWRDE